LLIGTGLPARLVKLVVDWYGKTFSVTKWNNSLSDPISIKSGIRQGGILSPILFNIYIDVIINALEISDNGCHIGQTYVGCVVYADDIILLSASVSRLQDMINTCVKKGAELDIIFNANKSKLFSVGPSCNNQYCNLVLGSDSIEWVKELKYLGLYFISCKKFKIDVSVAIKRFYASANAIFCHSKYVSEHVKLRLMESFVLPLLTYSLESINLTTAQMRQLNVCWNNVYRKIFNMHKWESVKDIQFYSGRIDLIHMLHMRKLNFFGRLLYGSHKNSVLYACGKGYSYNMELVPLCNQYNIDISTLGHRSDHFMYASFASVCT